LLSFFNANIGSPISGFGVAEPFFSAGFGVAKAWPGGFKAYSNRFEATARLDMGKNLEGYFFGLSHQYFVDVLTLSRASRIHLSGITSGEGTYCTV
jgi:hypothetical protein